MSMHFFRSAMARLLVRGSRRTGYAGFPVVARSYGVDCSTLAADAHLIDKMGVPLRFYYTREPGPEGQLLTEDGDAPGVSLAPLLSAYGPMPMRATLELVAYLADILTISEEDRAVHGAITPEGIFLDEGAAVSIGGWTPSPRPTRAPEGRAVGPATDVFGLGEVMLSVLTGRPLAEAPPNDRAVYEDYILARLSEVDWAAMGQKKWVPEVQHFVCAMLAHAPAERPAALDIANVLGGVAQVAPGDDLTAWVEAVFSGAQAPMGRSASPSAADLYEEEDLAPPVDEEDLGGPQALGGSPVSKTAALRLRKAASAKGESTAFWSRDKIASLLDEDEEDEPVRQTFVPGRKGGAPPPPPRPSGVDFNAETMRTPAAAPPVPPPTPPGLPRSTSGPVAAPPPPTRAIEPPIPPPTPPVSTGPVAPPPIAVATAAPVAPPPVASTPVVAAGPVVSGPVVSAPVVAPVPIVSPPAPAAPAGSKFSLPVIIGIVVVLLGICAGIPLAGVGVWYVTQNQAADGAQAVDVEQPTGIPPAADPPKATEDTGSDANAKAK